MPAFQLVTNISPLPESYVKPDGPRVVIVETSESFVSDMTETVSDEPPPPANISPLPESYAK